MVTFLNDLTGLIIPFLFTMFRKVVKIGKGLSYSIGGKSINV